MDTWTWFQSGINTDGAHNPVTTRKLEAGDILSLNTFPMIFGYYTPTWLSVLGAPGLFFIAAAAATQDGYWGDVFGAVLMTVLFGWIFWLFGTSRLKEL